MPFVATIVDAFSFVPFLTAVQNATHADLTDIYLNHMSVQNFLSEGTYLRLAVVQPTTSLTLTNQLTSANNFVPGGNGNNDNYAGYLWPTVNGQTTGYVGGANGILLATVQGSSQSATSLTWQFILQSSPTGTNPTTTGGDWTTLAQFSTSTDITIELNSTNTSPAVGTAANYTFKIAYSAGTTAFITASTTPVNAGGPTSGTITLDGIAYTITGTAAIAGMDYQLTLPEDTTVDNIDVDNTAAATVAQVSTYDIAQTGGPMDIASGKYARGTPDRFSLTGTAAATWTTIGLRGYTLDGAQTVLTFQNTQSTPYAIANTGASGSSAYSLSSGLTGGVPYLEIRFGITAQTHTLNAIVLSVN